ncbi:MAG: hypothetical protein R3Y51_05775 [Rikenellaceae bacterium]
MKDFDINKIGKKMPYSAPSDDFFEKFSADMLSRVEVQQKRRITYRRLISFSSAIAATFIIGFLIIFKTSDNIQIQTQKADYVAYENLNASIDSYLDDLSDSELSNLVSELAYQDDFYSNLPTD